MILAAPSVLLPDGSAERGFVEVTDSTITGVSAHAPTPVASQDAVDPTVAPEQVDLEALGITYLAPGFVDIHNHGGGGAAFTEGAVAAARAIALHRSHGTTSLMASLVTDTIDRLAEQVAALAPLVEAGELVGVHLEGPWLSDLHCGAHDPMLLRDPDIADIDRVLDAGEGTVAMVTLAVERPGGLEAVAHLAARGVIAAPGHSDAGYEIAKEAVAAGASVATHLFNAERPMHHRVPGLIPALLESPSVAIELIADGVHVHPAMLRHAITCAPTRYVLVTDAMAAAGAPDGDYRLGPLRVRVQDSVARLDPGGAIAGSTLTLDRAMRFLVEQVGVPVPEAVRAATLVPAETIGRADLGRLAPGARADLVALGEDLQVRAVMRGGRWVVPPR